MGWRPVGRVSKTFGLSGGSRELVGIGLISNMRGWWSVRQAANRKGGYISVNQVGSS